MKLLLVAAAVCCGILSAYGAKGGSSSQTCPYVPTSKSWLKWEKSGNVGLCTQEFFIFLRRQCGYSCDSQGYLNLRSCAICNTKDSDYPDCSDLICIISNGDEYNDSTESTSEGKPKKRLTKPTTTTSSTNTTSQAILETTTLIPTEEIIPDPTEATVQTTSTTLSDPINTTDSPNTSTETFTNQS